MIENIPHLGGDVEDPALLALLQIGLRGKGNCAGLSLVVDTARNGEDMNAYIQGQEVYRRRSDRSRLLLLGSPDRICLFQSLRGAGIRVAARFSSSSRTGCHDVKNLSNERNL